MKRTLIVICILASAILFMPSADAALVTFNYSGTFQSQAGFPAGLFSGATVTGSFTFDTATPDTSAPPTEGLYVDTLTQLSGTVLYSGGALNFHYGAVDGNMVISDNFPLLGGNFRDWFRVYASWSHSDGVFDDLPGYVMTSYLFEMKSETNPAPGYITSTALPLVPPALFDTPLITLGFDGQTLVFNATSLSPVPEPGMMMLVGSGLVGLAGWGRRRFKK